MSFKIKYPSGPNCSTCPYRSTSYGYAPHSGNLRTSQFLFLSERLGPEEVEAGRNFAGGAGRTLNALLRDTPVRRSEQAVANVVRCMPVEWTEVDGKQVPLLDKRGRPIGTSPSSGQISACAERYTDQMLRDFEGRYIVGLGAVPLRYMSGKPMAISKYRRTIFEPGVLIVCSSCEGKGTLPRPPKKCPLCKGKGNVYVETESRCGIHSTYTGKTKTKRACGPCEGIWFLAHPSCSGCFGKGLTPRPDKFCKTCEGSGKVPENPENIYVSDKLKPGQVFYPTYHPAMVSREPTKWTVLKRDFDLLPHIDEELKQASGGEYHAYPEVGDNTHTHEITTAHTVSVDIETGGIDPDQGDIICIGATNRILYGVTFYPEDPRIREILSRPKIVGQNFLLYDMWWLYKKGLHIPETTEVVDTRYLGKLCNPDTPNNLVYLAGEFARPSARGYWKTKEAYEYDIERVACLDVDITLRVEHGQWDFLEETGQAHVARDYIIPLSRVLFNMRVAGMKIDRDKMDQAREELETRLQQSRGLLPSWGGTGTEQQHAKVQNHLYNVLSLPVQKKRGTWKVTANAEALEELMSRLDINHKSVRHLTDIQVEEASNFIRLIKSCRGMLKLSSGFLRYKLSGADFVHPALNMGGSAAGKHEIGRGAATFRLSCADPNAQQVPEETRYIFIPDHPDWEIMSLDLKQAEVVGFLWHAEAWDVLDKVLRHGLDAHQELANKILGREADKPERDTFKNTTFAILFGEAPETSAARLHKPLPEILEARDFYYKMLPGVEEYRQRMISQCMNTGCVETPFDIRRYIRLTSPIGRAANQACNTPIQNIPPMVIGYAMIRIARELPKPARLWMQVHDEIVLTYPKELRKQVYECAYENLRMPVPQLPAAPLGMAGGLRFNVDVGVGPNWKELVKYENKM